MALIIAGEVADQIAELWILFKISHHRITDPIENHLKMTSLTWATQFLATVFWTTIGGIIHLKESNPGSMD